MVFRHTRGGIGHSQRWYEAVYLCQSVANEGTMLAVIVLTNSSLANKISSGVEIIIPEGVVQQC